jgi:uncharacterized protein YkwD
MRGHLRTAVVAAALAVATVTSPVLAGPAGAATAAHSTAKAKTVVTGWSVTPALVRLGSRLTITVQVRTASKVVPRYVELQRRQAGTATWHVVERVLTRTGSAKVHLLSATLGNWQFRVAVPATAKANNTTTAPRMFRVTRTGVPTLDARTTTLLHLVNQARSQARTCGSTSYPAVAPLAYNAALGKAAGGWATYLAVHNKFDHVIGGSTPTSRATAAGYRGGAGENIAAGYDTPAAVMAGWLKSPGHCSNIMNKQYQDLGIGYAYAANSTYKTYWVQDFGIRY